MNLSKRERIIVSATLSIALAALIYNFILEPIFIRWSNLDNEIASKLNIFRRNSELLAIYGSLESEHAKLSKYAKSAKKEEEEVASILAQIETVARNNSCFIANIKPRGINKLGSYKEVLIDATAESEINQFSKFLYDIETSKEMILKVRRFTISSKSGQPNIVRSNFLVGRLLID